MSLYQSIHFLQRLEIGVQGYKINVKYPKSKNNVQNGCKIPTKK